MAFCTIRSERQFCDQLRHNLLFQLFLDLNVKDEPFHQTTFTKKRERPQEADSARVPLEEARCRGLVFPGHFTLDSALQEAWTDTRPTAFVTKGRRRSARAGDDGFQVQAPPPRDARIDDHSRDRAVSQESAAGVQALLPRFSV